MFAPFFLITPLLSSCVHVDAEREEDLADLSLEELMNLEVSVASRSQQSIAQAPAAVYVLTGDEIRRAGHHSIQEALRMVPGFLVGHWQSTTWDATSRGFTSAFNHNILVLVDGVNVYTMMGTEGVRWHLEEIDLEDVERIEVVRGPGAALWGQNAVNGVINVVTKNSADTQGPALRGLVGVNGEKSALRYGGQLDDSGGTYRVWGVGSRNDGLVDSDGNELDNQDWWIARLGARVDRPLEGGGLFSVIASAFEAEREHDYFIDFPDGSAQFVSDETPERGQSLVATWDLPHTQGDRDRITSSYQHVTLDREDYDTRVDIVDLDWMRRTQLGEWNALTYGLGWRFVGWEFDGGFSYNFEPESSTNWSVRAFVLDEISMFDGDWRVILGAGVDHNDLTGTEVQPTLRTIVQAHPELTVWGAASRAVRTPSLLESYDYSQFYDALNDINYIFKGNDDLEAEEVYAFELGLRWHPHEKVSLDTVLFYNDLDHVVTNEDGTFTAGSPNIQEFTYGNLGEAEAWGYEIALDAVLTEIWRVRAAATHFEQNNDVASSSTDPLFQSNDNLFPENIANLRSDVDLGQHWELDLGLYFVDPIRDYATPSYLRTDLRLGYNPTPELRFSIGVQNADDPHHPEDGGSFTRRNFWAGLSWSK